MKLVEIVPAQGGWMLLSETIDNELFFQSLASAESAAIRLAQGLAEVGEATQISIQASAKAEPRRFAIPALRLVHG